MPAVGSGCGTADSSGIPRAEGQIRACRAVSASWQALAQWQGWLRPRGSLPPGQGTRFCSLNTTQASGYLFCARILNLYTKFIPHRSVQPSCSHPVNWGKKTGTQRHRYTQIIPPSGQGGPKKPKHHVAGDGQTAAAGQSLFLLVFATQAVPERSELKFTLLSWKFPTAAFTTG